MNIKHNMVTSLDMLHRSRILKNPRELFYQSKTPLHLNLVRMSARVFSNLLRIYLHVYQNTCEIIFYFVVYLLINMNHFIGICVSYGDYL